MPKARTPLDMERIEALQRQGLSRRQIAQELGMAESTLRDNLRAMQQTQASPGLPQGDQGSPRGDAGIRPPNGSLDLPQPDQAETAALSGRATPPLHPGGPEDTDGGPCKGTPDIHEGGPHAMISAQDLQDLQALLAWWRARQRLVAQAGDPERELQRQTYHVEKRFIDLIRREADLQGLTYAAVVNRAFAQYFAERST
jgi:AraC-like DNA-binding protein